MPLRPLAASANVGNEAIVELESWVAKGQLEHSDIVVFGMQESTYKAPHGHEPDAKDAAFDAKMAKDNAKAAEDFAKKKAARGAAESDEEESDDEDGKKGKSASHAAGVSNNNRHLLSEIDKHVGSKFFLLDSVQRTQMRVLVYVRNSFKGKVSEVETGAENTGFAGVAPNKGGQAVKFVVENTSFVFVNSHLAAHETAKKCNKRNENVEEIFNGVRFGDQRFDFCQFDHVFWFGDLNYRCEPPPSVVGDARRAMVMKMVEADDFAGLWKIDELQREVTAGRVYANFKTPPCEFKPTFKVARKVETEYNPKRIPSYCDRILFHSHKHLAANLSCHAYTGCHAFSTSDHKPIIGLFSVLPTAKPALLFGAQAALPQLKFFDLKARDLTAMDIGVTLQSRKVYGFTVPTVGKAKSDPYVVAHCFPPDLRAAESDVRTKWIYQTLNPDWKETLMLSLRASSFATLSQCSVKLSVFDYDVGNAHDLIGSVDFSFEELEAAAAGANGGVFEFQRDIVGFGKVQGSLSGKIDVRIPTKDGTFPRKGDLGSI